MIAPSRRRRSDRASDRPLHRRLAGRRDRQRHLLLASVVALLATLATLPFGLEPLTRAAVALGLAGASWLVPLRGSDDWALDLIARQSGLAYQTRLEQVEAEDAYGFVRALEERAETSTRRVEAPQASAWWLPVLALALGLLFIPDLAGSSFRSGGNGRVVGNLPSSPETAPLEESREPIARPEDEQTDRLSATEGADGAQRQADADRAAAAGDGAGEREALDRFLRNVRERPEQEEPQADGEGNRAGEPGEGAAPQAPREGEPGPGEERGGRQEQVGADGDQGTEGTDTEGAGQPGGTPDQETNPFGTVEEQAGGETAQDPDAVPSPDGQGEPQPEPGEEGVEAGGNEDAQGDQAGTGEGAGGRPTAEQPAGRAGETEGEELFLEGRLGEGPIDFGGMVQLPGEDEGAMPPGRTVESYRREAERAISEGRIPLEYQEVIRNYFR